MLSPAPSRINSTSSDHRRSMEAHHNSPEPDPLFLDEFDNDFVDDEDDDDDDLEQEEREESESMAQGTEFLLRRLSAEGVVIRVNDVIIKGNYSTTGYLIASEVEPILRDATSFQQLLRAATIANARLQKLGVFDSVTITLDAGPPELPGTANVVIEVSEKNVPVSGELGIFSESEARSVSLEGSLKLKNLSGYGDIWDGSVAYGWGQPLEISVGVSLPKVKALANPLSAKISLLSQDWLKFRSHREQVLGLSLSLLTSGNHDVTYNLSRRTLTDPSQISSDTVQRQLGHGLFSALKYAFKIDQRDSATRPTQGHAFVSTTQIGGHFPDIKSLRFIRQEFDLRYAVPLGFYRAALNFGISGGIIFPWGSGHLNTASYSPERVFMGGNSSPVFSLRGPASILGFKNRGLGPAEPIRIVRENSSDGMDHRGGDLTLTAFADFSFDLPLSVFQEAGIHGHVFASTGSLNKLTENSYKEFSSQKFRDSFRTSAGFGIIIPTKLFRMEVNYCYALKQHGHDQAKSGVQFNFSSLQ